MRKMAEVAPGLSASECLRDGGSQGVTVEREAAREAGDVPEILDPRVVDTAAHHRLELLGDHRFARVGPEAGGRQVEEGGIVVLLALGRDDVAEPDVHLQREADAAEVALEPRPQPALRLVAPDISDPDRRGVENDAVLRAGNAADGLHGGADRGRFRGTRGKKVHIPGRPQFRLGPHPEERRALERESVHLGRGGKAIEEPLGGIAVEQEVEVHPPFVRETLQTGAHRGGHVPEFPPSSHASSA